MTSIYVVPTITDERILPTSTIRDEYLSNLIECSGSPGEYRPATFVVQASGGDISGLLATPSDLVGETRAIPASLIDIRVVKVWYQAGETIRDITHKQLVPELLLKNDALVRVENGENFLDLPNGAHWISDPTIAEGFILKTPEEFPVADSAVLQPVDIPDGTNKQFWVTINIPNNTTPGLYTGVIQLTAAGEVVAELTLALDVLPINLLPPYLIYSIYYEGRLHPGWPAGTVSHAAKNTAQMAADLFNMAEHGVINPSIYQYLSYELETALRIRSQLGLNNQPLYYWNLEPWGHQPPDQVLQIINLARTYGFTDVYIYGADEQRGQGLIDLRPDWEAIKATGAKIFAAGVKVGHYDTYPESEGNFGLVGDIQDLLVCYGPPDPAEAARWHSLGKQIFCYANPQVGEEKPETYRRNFGLLLWQNDYDGAMDFAYQYGFGDVWNDFDHATYRDHNFTYPTVDGVIDTIQWEGFREGITDIRYLTTLLIAMGEAQAAGIDTSAAEGYLTSLKTADLATLDLDQVRQDLIDHILSLQGEIPPSPPPALGLLAPVAAVMALLAIVAVALVTRRET